MKTAERKFDWLSALLVIALHLLICLILRMTGLRIPEMQEESGVPVMLGALGSLDTDYDLTEVESYSAPVPVTPAADVQAEPLVTQSLEETVALEDGEKKVDIPESKPQPTAEELRAQEEQRVADEANQLMKNLFGQSAASSAAGDDSSDAEGTPGSTEGNSTQGKVVGIGGFGTFDLGGRDVDGNGLQRPAYNVQEEGRVVVTITVNPAGKVIATSINKRSNTTNAQLRAAAEEAARRTVFTAVDGPDNQTGTITYYFRLK